MVSIPSSQIKNIIYFDVANKKPHSKSTKVVSTTKSIIKAAENNGYFTHINAEYLNENFNKQKREVDSDQNKNIDLLKNIKVINLHHQNIQKIDCIEYCRNVVYLNLSKNFISDFSALKLCQQLICLDLSANLIESLPDFDFWKNLLNLKFLYLHDNPIANPDSIMGLCHSSNVAVLTLWDTPLALRRKYRHFIVNSIWSLKILDHHFVSDEEIIEDADFRHSCYRSISVKLKIASYRSYEHQDVIKIEQDIQRFLVEMNTAISHISPVLIIQRWIRGFLIRRKYQSVKSSSVSHEVKVLHLPIFPVTPILKETEADDKVKYLTIDLVHLNQASTLENLDKEANMRNLITSALNMPTYRSVSKMDHDQCSPEHISRALNIEKSITNNQMTFQYDFEEHITFRFKGMKPPITSKHPSTEIISEKHRSHCFIREADRNYHDQMLSVLPEIKSRQVKKINSNLLFRKAQGCMGLFLLNKWDKTDRDIEDIEKLNERINQVQMTKNERELNQCKLDEARLRKVAIIKSQHIDHKNHVEKSVEMEKDNHKKNAEELKMKKIEASEKRTRLMNEMGFSLDFRSKQTAACKAVDKFEQMTYKQEQLQVNKNAVVEIREKMRLETETVKAYLENQTFSRKTEKRLENSALDLQILQQTNNRMNDAKMRVEKLKAIRRQVSCPRLPVIQMNVESLLT